MSGTVVTTALPKIIGGSHGSRTRHTWIVTSTLLPGPATGWLGMWAHFHAEPPPA
ncbi:hypothetical protein [Nonomuraea insulae]|uniref:Uncharacterized protein n=1 Tax=Nonomuraea insulae TaxID=1616787 RepID=A0ABW1CI31_9ACTN